MKKFETISAIELMDLATGRLSALHYRYTENGGDWKTGAEFKQRAKEVYAQICEVSNEVRRLNEREKVYGIAATDQIHPLNTITTLELLKFAHFTLFGKLYLVSEELNDFPDNEHLQRRETKYRAQLNELQREIRSDCVQ